MDGFPYQTTTILLWLLCTTIMLNSVTCNTMMKIHCNEQDKSTLLHFKQGVKDPYAILSSWVTEKDCCEWIGVLCDNTTGRVTELSLPCHTIPPDYGDTNKSHCLAGELDLSLLDLEFLSLLNLSNNDFKTIQYDYSVHNQTCNELSRGTLPPHQCGNSSNLHYLDLSQNDDLLVDNLGWIPHLYSLKYLDFSGVDLHRTDWLRSMTMLPSLTELHLEKCQLRDIYLSLQYANFTSLKVLDISNNDFISELPGWVFNISCDISIIDLSNNKMHGPIPNWLGQLKQLQELDLSSNSFFGSIPTSLGNLSSLTKLDLFSNQLSGNLPQSLVNLSKLEVFDVFGNFLSGNISERNLYSFTNLKHLDIGSPGLIFDFDPKWIPPFQLQVILFGYVAPKFPSWIYTQTSLKSLTIVHSRVSFEPLDKFWKFSAQLEFFSLTNNSINADMSNVSLNSKVIWLNGNNLRGGVPQVSPNVTILELGGNSLSGSIYPFLCHKMKGKRNIEYLELSYNNLSGEIPNCWKDWKFLLHVSLGSNNLTGKIPNSMGSLSKLISLDLSNNTLSGQVPLSLQNCKKLWILNLAENMFSGVISGWMSPSLKALQLRSNKFSGSISLEICQLHSLKILDFANNRLFGTIPYCLQNMTSMISEDASLDVFSIRVLVLNLPMSYTFNIMLLIKGLKLYYGSSMYAIDLSSNNLSGIVPTELTMLTRLQSLNLSHNQLVGMVPQEIGKLQQLESLDLSCNQLSGQIPQSMSGISFLEVLNLSFNNFMGKIPLGIQLQGFTNLSYMGNPQLCGPPLTKNCTQGEKPHNTELMAEDNNDEVQPSFYVGLGIGFAAGFLGVLGVIYCNRQAYFKFLSRLFNMFAEIS